MVKSGEFVNIRAHIFVSGKVQGVFFRAKVMQEAVRLGVTGWVRNMRDGRVEAVIEGEKEAVDKLVAFCKNGPKGALVTGLDLKLEPFTGEFATFKIRYFNGEA